MLLEERAAVLATKDPYQILGVTRGANPSDLQAAFLKAAKLFHPDRISPELADLRDTADKVFAAITDAHKLLADPERRRAFDSGGPPKDDASEVARVLGAATNFAKAEHFLKRNELGKALDHAKLAADADADRSEYIALLGWLESMGSDKNAARDALATLNRALAIDNDDDRALYYRGAILKRLGKDEDAIKDFRRAVTLNPQNVDAVRELRLHGMRSEKAAAPQNAPGLFSHWFGKK